jgi:hypothetical protein
VKVVLGCMVFVGIAARVSATPVAAICAARVDSAGSAAGAHEIKNKATAADEMIFCKRNKLNTRNPGILPRAISLPPIS